MKSSAFLSMFLLFLIVFFVGCAQYIPQKIEERVFKEQDRVINLKLHERFVIELQSHIGGGYSWVFLDSTYQQTLKLENIEYIRPSPISQNETAYPTNRYHFQTIQKGILSLKMAYARPWEKEIPEQQKRVFSITIQ